MNKKNKEPWELWCEALESGEYEQTTGILCGEEEGKLKYCCLGVACEVYGKKCSSEGEKVYNDNSKIISGGLLPDDVRDWLGVSTCCGSYHDKSGNTQSLIDDNDYYRMDFKNISKIIRSRPNGLFK